ncbi:MAG: MMPL family transporter [Polyangiaceae bacterium]
MSARPRVLRLFLILVTVASAWLTYTKLRLSNDLTDLFPNRGEAAMLTHYLRAFGGGDLAVVLVRGSDPAEVEAASHDLAANLKTKKTVVRVLDEISPPHAVDPTLAWLFAGAQARHRLAAALTPEGMRARLADTRDLLLAPGSAEAEDWLARDPLRLTSIPWEGRNELAAGLTTSSGGFFTADHGRARLVVAEPRGSAFDGDAAEAFVDDANAAMDAARAKHPTVTTALTGGHAIARATASLLQRDMILSGTLSTVFASITFFLTFRRGRALIAVLPPLALGTLWTTGIAAFFPGGLSAIATAFAAVVIGVGVDTGVHVYAALLEGRRRGLAPEDAARFARSATWKPTLLAATAAGLAFLSLGASELAAVRQLGFLCGAGEVLTAIGILLVTPTIGALLEKGPPPPAKTQFWIAIVRRLTSTRKRAIIVLAVAFTPIVVLSFLGWPKPSDTIVAIRPRALQPLVVQRQIYELFGSKEGQWIVVSESNDRNLAMARGDKVAEALDALAESKTIEGYDSLTTFAPSPELQRARLDIRDHDPAFNLPKKRADLESALTSTGFDLAACAPALEAFSHPSEETHVIDEKGPLAWLVSRHVAVDRGETLVVSYVRPSGDAQKDELAIARIHQADPEAVVTGYQHLETALRASLAHDLPIVGMLALVLTILTLRTILKRGSDVALSLATIVIEVAAVALLMRLLHVRWHVYDALVLPVLIGITMDESMFLLHAARSGQIAGESLDHAIGRALEEQGALVVATGLTTAAGFGALLVCKFEGLFDLGAVGALGSTLGLLSALFVVPAGLRALEPRS